MASLRDTHGSYQALAEDLGVTDAVDRLRELVLVDDDGSFLAGRRIKRRGTGERHRYSGADQVVGRIRRMSGFVDQAQVHVKAGNGGAGAVAFRREAHVDRGGPDGGDGGRGGDVWLVATTNQSSLLGFRDHPHRRATDGGHGGGKRRHGANGADLEVPVPVGTRARGGDGIILCDLAAIGDRWLAGHGGRGGRGNASFLSNRRRAPNFAEQGERGEEEWYDLELLLGADVALVGFPNVGKSTLIARISAARPKIADYPFTTLEPHLGVVRMDDQIDFTWPTSRASSRARPRARGSATNSSATSPAPGSS